jgi:YafQ family addiction module toxin component
MKYGVSFSNKIYVKLSKLRKRNPKVLQIISKKIREISENPDRYKNLRYDLKGTSRVHIDSHFVLTFEILEDEHKILFLDFDHHDKVY